MHKCYSECYFYKDKRGCQFYQHDIELGDVCVPAVDYQLWLYDPM